MSHIQTKDIQTLNKKKMSHIQTQNIQTLYKTSVLADHHEGPAVQASASSEEGLGFTPWLSHVSDLSPPWLSHISDLSPLVRSHQ